MPDVPTIDVIGTPASTMQKTSMEECHGWDNMAKAPTENAARAQNHNAGTIGVSQ